MTKFYLAYGSNLHPIRLQVRVPRVEFINLTNIPGYQLRFHKRHEEDGSGKCNMFRTNNMNDRVYGAIYSIPDSDKSILDQFEGPGYRCETIEVKKSDGELLPCFAYIAEESHIDDLLIPHHWYKTIVLLGATYHAMPADYIQAIKDIRSTEDPDLERRKLNLQLVDQIKKSLR